MEMHHMKVVVDDRGLLQLAGQVLELRARVEALERAVEQALQAIVMLGECHPNYVAGIPREN